MMKRRDFLKSVALAGASASVTGGMGMIPALFTPGTAHAAGRNKLVFISDLHMNVDGPYSWLVKHAKDLGQFLNTVNARDDVAELVILGDMLDDWVSPVANTPQTFADVLEASNNAAVVASLRAVCDNPNIAVTYVTGNHDMLSFESQNQQVIADAFPGMSILSDSPGLGAYTKDNVIWAEHGHRYTLFNAPDTWSRSAGHLSLGYFISRLAASKSVSSGQVVTTPDVLDRFVKSPSLVNTYLRQGGYEEVGSVIDDALIVAVFNAISLWSGNWPWNTFDMDGLDNFAGNPSVEDIAFTYDTIFSGWPSRQDVVDHYEAVWNDLGSLNSPANLLFEMPERIKDLYPFTPRIVLFGHTHQAAFQYHHSGEAETIYANTGTWIDGKPMTWVEIEINDGGSGQRNYTVSLWFYGDSSPKYSGSVIVQFNKGSYMIRHR